MSLFKKSLDRIQLPPDVKSAVRANLQQQPTPKRGINVRRILPAALAAALAIAICISLIPAMLSIPSNKAYVSVDDWVAQLFENESVKNEGGMKKDPYDNPWSSGGRGDDLMYETAPDPTHTGAIGMGEDKIYGEPTEEALLPEIDAPADKVEGGKVNTTIAAGTLTAGRTDDNASFGSFLGAMKKLEKLLNSRKLYPTKRITVTVPDVFNAMVALSDKDGNVLSTARTDIHGVAYLYYDLRGGSSVPHAVGVSKDGAFAQQTLAEGEDSVTIELDLKTNESVKLDMMIMLDTTGSMGDELEYVKAELKDMISRIAAEGQTADIRLSVNFYRDHGDEYTVKYFEFTSDIDKCVEYISSQCADGGGNTPEAVDEALVNGVCDHMWRDEAAKVMFMVLDAPAHPENERQGVNSNLARAITSAANQGIRIVPVVASGADDDLEATMRTAAAVTGGKYIYLTNDSGIGFDHKDPVDVQSSVFPLNELMVNTVLEYIKK